jgi:hypothetical protein
MNLDIVTEIWAAMKPLFATSDRPEAAETFVNVLIDNDFDPKDLKKAFKKDGNIVNALGLYEVDDLDLEVEEDEYGYDDYDDNDDEDEDNY